MEEKVFLNEKVAKKLFKNEKYGKMLSARVISDYLGADYDEVYNNIHISTDEIAFSALTVNSTADAIYYDDNMYFNIEINFYKSKSKDIQLQGYVSQLFLGQLRSHKDYYRDIKKVIQICIDSYDYFGKNEFMYKVALMEENYHIKYSDKIQIIRLNIDYLRKIKYTLIMEGSNRLMKDLYFMICNKDDRLGLVYEKDNLMKDIIEESKKIAGLEKLDLFLTDEELRKMDEEHYRKEGYDAGKADGAKDEKIQIAKNLLSMGISLKDIAISTNLTEEVAAELIK